MSYLVSRTKEQMLWDALDSSNKNRPTLTFILKMKPNLALINNGRTIFHEAVSKTNLDALRLLIKAAREENQLYLLDQPQSQDIDLGMFNFTPLEMVCYNSSIIKEASLYAIALLEGGASLYSQRDVSDTAPPSSFCLRKCTFPVLDSLLKYAKVEKAKAEARAPKINVFMLPFLHSDLFPIIHGYESSFNEKEWFDALHYVPVTETPKRESDLPTLLQVANYGSKRLMNLTLEVGGDVDFPLNGVLKSEVPISLFEFYSSKHVLKDLTYLRFHKNQEVIFDIIKANSKQKEVSEARLVEITAKKKADDASG